MARQQSNARLQTVDARNKLAARHEPYWHEVRRGLHLGFRKGSTGGTWWLREYRGKRYWKRRMGLADGPDLPRDGVAVFSWQDALKAALGDDRPTASATARYTVADALDAYFTGRRAKSSAESATADRVKAEAAIVPKLGDKDVGDLTTDDLRTWRDALVKATDDRDLQRRSQATANRVWSILRAALNLAYANGRAPSADAWRRIKPFGKVDAPRTRFLSVAEAARLLNRLPPDFRRLARGALNTGMRLGELLALKVADIVDGQIFIRIAKSGRGRTVPLSKSGREFFDEVTAGKAGDALVFTRSDGNAWHRMDASRQMARASIEAKLEPPARFHDLRRSYASLLINAGTDAEIIQELLGHADMRMTRRAYAHLLNATVRKAVKKRLPDFGNDGGNVRKLRSAKDSS